MAALCDPRTEGLLGITHEHVKRQEITTSITTHIPARQASSLQVMGADIVEAAALAKAQKIFNSLQPASTANADAEQEVRDESAAPLSPSVEGWTVSNSAPRSAVTFGLDSLDPPTAVSRRLAAAR